jgi:hypothetical protein
MDSTQGMQVSQEGQGNEKPFVRLRRIGARINQSLLPGSLQLSAWFASSALTQCTAHVVSPANMSPFNATVSIPVEMASGSEYAIISSECRNDALAHSQANFWLGRLTVAARFAVKICGQDCEGKGL